MKDRKIKLMPASIYDVAAMETWLADQAKQGWLLGDSIGRLTAKLERGTPVECQYRLEPVDGAELIQDEALRDYYAEAGWEFICFSANRDFRVWRSTRRNPVEIHSDPEVEAGAYRRLAHRLYQGCAISVCYTLLWLFLIWPRSTALAGWLEGQVFSAPNIGGLLVTLIYLYFLVWIASGAWAVYRLRKHLKQGIPLDHARRYSHWWRNVNAVGLALAALLLWLSVCWWPSWRPIQSDTPPVLLAAELGLGGEDREAFLWRGGNLLTSQAVQGIERTEAGVIMDTKYAVLRMSFMAELLLQEMTEWWDPTNTVALADSRFDEAYYMDGGEWQRLAIRRGKRVLYVAAKVPDDLREHIDDYGAALEACR